MRLIDADALKTTLGINAEYCDKCRWGDIRGRCSRSGDFEIVCCVIDEAPTIDAVEVVRCKDCRYCCRHEFFGKPYFTCDIANQYMTGDIIGVGFEPPEDWFCADGERRRR